MNKVCFLIIATNNYLELGQQAALSVLQNVKFSNYKTDVIIFTDKTELAKHQNPHDNIRYLHLDHNPWPLCTLLRYATFIKYKEYLSEYDYLYYMDADLKVVAAVGDEILSECLVATIHPGYAKQPRQTWPYDNTEGSTACIKDTEKNTYYFIGAFQGGKTDAYLKACFNIANNISIDLKYNYIAKWHDESHWNKYLLNNNICKILSTDYCWPEEYSDNITKKIIARSKNHEKIRSEVYNN